MLIAILVIAGIGFVGALALALADRFLAVREDPRIGLVSAALPGANCGGCGFPGCDGYARALVAGKAANGACTVGGAAVAAEIGRILGIDAGSVSRRVALVKCCGSRSETVRVGDYNGLCDCGLAAATAGGDKGCRHGCLGYGACANVCPQHAISVKDGLAKVEKRLCIGCGKCVSVCPRKVIELVPAEATIHVLCNNPTRGPEVRKVCGVGCLGCHICERSSGGPEAGRFTFNGFLAKVNYENPPTDEQLAAKCPAKCIAVDPHWESAE
ncbi:MAG: RnfABCDGE type electron transport complex subunit B [Kiritimatiellia bacterium]|nr:RnfABCDGE type electron transport complex subunit B [Kiritimatiellia bacterium]